MKKLLFIGGLIALLTFGSSAYADCVGGPPPSPGQNCMGTGHMYHNDCGCCRYGWTTTSTGQHICQYAPS